MDTRHTLLNAARRRDADGKRAALLATQAAREEKESTRRAVLDVRADAARQRRDVSMAANRVWYYTHQTRRSASLPGPGAYSVERSGAFSRSAGGSRAEPLAAMSGRRPLFSVPDSPGPAAYETLDRALDRYRRAGAAKLDGRLPSLAAGARGPGPADYSPTRPDLRSLRAPSMPTAPTGREPPSRADGPAAKAHSPQLARREVRCAERDAAVRALPCSRQPPARLARSARSTQAGSRFAVDRSEFGRREGRMEQRRAQEDARAQQPGPAHYAPHADGAGAPSLKAHRFSSLPARTPLSPEGGDQPGPGSYFPSVPLQRERDLARQRRAMLEQELWKPAARGPRGARSAAMMPVELCLAASS